MDVIQLRFVKLSENEPWKLITYNSYVEDYSYKESEEPPARILPMGVHSYLKSKFETIDRMAFRSPN